MTTACEDFSHPRDAHSARIVRRWLEGLDAIGALIGSDGVEEMRERYLGEFDNVCEWVENGAPWIGPPRVADMLKVIAAAKDSPPPADET